MKKDILGTNLDLTNAIKKYVHEKVDYLDRFIDENDESAYAKVEVEKTTDHHQKGEIYRAEINLHIAGNDFRAESTSEDLYAALDEAKDAMSKEVRRNKNRRTDMIRKGARKLKQMIRRQR